MKRFVYFLVILSMVMLACNIASTVTPTAGIPTAVSPAATSALPTGLEPTGQAPTVPPVTSNVTCNNLTLYFDPVLGSGFKCETIAEVPEGIIVFPQHTQVTLEGYVLTGKFFDPQILVFPVQRYTELLPDFMPGNLTALQSLISGGAPDNSSMPFGSSLPFLPTFNAGQIFHAQYQTLNFNSGGGIRYITLLAQNFAVINNHDLFYTYQGLTTDGKYWVSAILPIANPVLPENSDTVPGGQTYDQFTATYTTYATDIIAQLNSQTPASYTPSLDALDALVSSITVQP